MRVRDVVAYMDTLAPFELAQQDNVGLLIGDSLMEVSGVMVALDATEAVIADMRQTGANLLITHHPLMYRPVQRICADTTEGKVIMALLTQGYAHICAHTNLDIAPGGVNDVLAHRLALEHVTGEGLCRWGTLAGSLSALEARSVFETALMSPVRLYGDALKPVHSVLIASGAGSDMWREALDRKADAFLTGEMRHHDILAATASGLSVYEAGHFATENPAMDSLALALQNWLDGLELSVPVCRPSGRSFPIY